MLKKTRGEYSGLTELKTCEMKALGFTLRMTLSGAN